MAKTIYTYLHDDNLSGSKRVTMDNCSCVLYGIQRTDNDFLNDFKEELQKPALYILLNKEIGKAYIGETDTFYSRLQNHIANKDFWTEALAFIASDDTLSKTEVQFLEHLAYKEASQMNVYDLSENTQVPKEPHMSVIQKSKTKEFFKFVKFLTKFVGCDIFEPNVGRIMKSSRKPSEPTVVPAQIPYNSEDLKGKICLSFNGEGKYSKRDMVLQIVKQYVKKFPNSTFEELRSIFKRDYLQRFSQYEFLESDIAKAKNWKELGEDHVHYFVEDKNILVSGDGIPFVVCVEWDKNNIIKVLGIAKALGWKFEIVK